MSIRVTVFASASLPRDWVNHREFWVISSDVRNNAERSAARPFQRTYNKAPPFIQSSRSTASVSRPTFEVPVAISSYSNMSILHLRDDLKSHYNALWYFDYNQNSSVSGGGTGWLDGDLLWWCQHDGGHMIGGVTVSHYSDVAPPPWLPRGAVTENLGRIGNLIHHLAAVRSSGTI